MLEGEPARKWADLPPEEMVRWVFRRVARELWEGAPPKIEGGSPARAQFLADVLSVQSASAAFGAMDAFTEAMASPWPNRDEWALMTNAEVNEYLAERGISVRVVDDP